MELSDEELVALYKSGQASAFEPLFRRYERRVFNLIARTLGSTEDAEDLKQEVFFRAYKSLGTFKGNCRFSTWIFRIAANLCLDQIKKRRIPTTSMDELIEERTWQASGNRCLNDPQTLLERRELAKSVQHAIESLPPHYRILIVLRHIDGMSYEEIASVMGCSVNALNVRLHRAREAFKSKMRPYLSSTGENADELQKRKTVDNVKP